MNVHRIGDLAQADLDEIWRYIAADAPGAADRFIGKVIAKFAVLAHEPGIGRKRPELGAGLRSFSVGSYLIFYRPLPDGIEVVRVLSGHRDLPKLFSP